jgi:TonB family protein
MVHDRFYARWDQPLGVGKADENLVVKLKIRVRKDGTVVSREMVSPSGNAAMDESVMNAAQKVQRIDALPGGFQGDGSDFTIQFTLD